MHAIGHIYSNWTRDAFSFCYAHTQTHAHTYTTHFRATQSNLIFLAPTTNTDCLLSN